MTDQQISSDKSAEFKAWKEIKGRSLLGVQPYSEFERLLAEAEAEKKLLFGDGE